MLKKSLHALTWIVAVLIIALVGYFCYLQIHYYRIADKQTLSIKNPQKQQLQTNKTYTLSTYNIGFGAYSPDFTFFMDKNQMKDGPETQGKNGKAKDKETVLHNTIGVINTVKKLNSDFMFFQEVDTNSSRSYHVNQVKQITHTFNNYANVFANNFHSVFLAYPLTDPHGAVQSGLLSLSRYRIDSATRRKYPISQALISKFFDLDRCFVVLRLPVSNNKQLVLINSHMSAYDKGGKMRAKQLALLNSVMRQEVKAGNYVIVGGDFNHALGQDMLTHFANQQEVPDWVSVLTNHDLTNGIHFVRAQNTNQVPTCRGTDIAYTPNKTYQTVVDGFLVSDNVVTTATNIQTNYAYSDHNPVQLKFTLK